MDNKKFNSSTYLGLISEISDKFRNSKEYEKAIEILLKCLKDKGTVFTMGCGGSASTATHFTADLAKTTITNTGDPKRFKTMALVDNIPLVSAWINDFGWNSIFAEQLRPWLNAKDVIIGFSVHGGSGEMDAGPWSQNLISAMKLANDIGAKIIGFSGFNGGAMKKMADVCLVVPITDEIYGTAVVEAMHVVLHHGLIFDIKERMKNA